MHQYAKPAWNFCILKLGISIYTRNVQRFLDFITIVWGICWDDENAYKVFQFSSAHLTAKLKKSKWHISGEMQRLTKYI